MTGQLLPSIAARLRALTPARVGLGRAGVSQQLRDVLAFQQAHAMARDAVHAALDPHLLASSIAAIEGVPQVLLLRSAASDRQTYLQRPDLGRALDDRSRQAVAAQQGREFDLAIVIADGLSALAVERHAVPLLHALLPKLESWSIAPVCVVEQGRVAIGDEIGEMLRARLTVVLIGERPGLSSPDSLGAYVTWMPRRGRTDAERVCVSNIREEGLNYADGAAQLRSVLALARQNQLTGVALRAHQNILAEGAQR
jgi:ethanolamine ammonia-lyase small subunit